MLLDTSDVRTLDVRITAADQEELFDIGATAMEDFLQTWDHESYRRNCRGS